MSSQHLSSSGILLSLTLLVLSLQSCGVNYAVPGGPADMSIFGARAATQAGLTDPGIHAELNKQPLATFPASIAVARVQANGYSSWCGSGYGQGRYSVLPVREVETDEDSARLAKLPMVTAVAPIGRLLLPQSLQSDYEMRRAAASLHADMLLLYTFDTTFRTEDFAAPLTVVTLGLFPSKTAHVNSTASAILLDTRNGYVYGTVESSSKQTQLANAWTSEQAVDDSRRRAEREAFEGLVGEFEKMWGRVVLTHSGNRPRQHASFDLRPGHAQEIDARPAPAGVMYATPSP